MKIRSIAFLLTVFAVVVGCWCFFVAKNGKPERETLAKSMIAKGVRRSADGPVRHRVSLRNRGKDDKDGKAFGIAVANVIDRPNIEETLKDEELTELHRQILMELRIALDLGDKEAVLEIVQRMFQMGRESGKDWVSLFPVNVRRAAIGALGWIGSDSVPELAMFLEDPDPSIRDLALSQVESIISDFEIGDYELSDKITELMKVLTDENAVQSLMFEIPLRMRNSVGIDCLVKIAGTGSPTAQEHVLETVEFFTGQKIETIEQALEWKLTHPDGAHDDQLYGGFAALFGGKK